MKILIITDAWKPQINGVVRTYEHIIEELSAQGHTIEVISPSDFPWQIAMPGYAEIKLALFPYRRLENMINHFAPDIIHIGTEGFLGRAGVKYCRKHGFKFTSCYHSHFPDYVAKRAGKYVPFLYHPVRRYIIGNLKKFHHHASAMFVGTQSLEEELKLWGFKTPMVHLSRGVRFDLFSPGVGTMFHDLKKPVALYVGRIAIEKNLEDFLKMAWDGSKVIIGEGPDLAMLKRRYPATHFLGQKDKHLLGDYYRSADLFVFPSRTDTFGMVLIEALACGLPVAAYHVTGPRDIITHDYLGALHNDDLVVAARYVLTYQSPDDQEKRAQHIRNHYSWSAVAQQFLECITAIGK